MAQTGRTVVIEIQAKAQSANRALDQVDRGIKSARKAAKQASKVIEGFAKAANESFSSTVSNIDQFNRKLHTLEGSFEDLKRRSKISGQSIERAFHDAIGSVEGLQRAIRHTYSELVERTGQGVRSVQSMEAAFADLQKRAKLTGDQLQNSVVAGQNSVASSGIHMRSSLKASANNLGFEMVQAAQDAKFGLAGVANQIPLMTEQLTQLTLKSGSTTSALSSLGQAFIGPVGIVAAITLLLTYQDDLIGFFTSTEESAEDASDKFEGFFDVTGRGVGQIEELRTEFDELAGTISFTRGAIRGLGAAYSGWWNFVVQTFPGLRLLRDGYENLGGSIEELDRRIEELTGIPLTGAQFQQLAERTRRLRESLASTEPAAEVLRAKLESMGVDVRRIVSGSFEEAAAEVQRFEGRVEELIETLEGGDILPEFAQLAQKELQRLRDQTNLEIEVGITTEEDALEEQIDFVRDALERGLEEITASGGTFQDFLFAFSELRQIYADLKKRQEEFNEGVEESTSLLQELIEQRRELRAELQEETGEQRRQIGTLRQQIEQLEQRLETERSINEILAERPELAEEEARQLLFVRQILEELEDLAPDQPEEREFEEPPIVQSFLRLIDTIEVLESRIALLGTEVELGLITPLEASQLRVRFLTREVQELLDRGFDPASDRVQEVVSRLRDAQKAAAAWGVAMEVVNRLSRAIGEQVGFIIFGNEQELDRLRKERDRIREQLQKARSQATVTNPNIAQISQLRKELAEANKELREMETMAGRVRKAFKNMGDAILGILRQVVAQLVAAVAKAALLRAIAAAFNIAAPGFGSLVVAALSEGGPVVEAQAQMQHGGFVSGPGGPTSDRVPALLSDGEFVVNAQSTAVAPELLRRINDNPGFAKSLSQSFVTNNSFADGGFVGGSPGSLSRATSTKADVRLEVVPGVLPSGDLSFGVRRAESTRERLGYTTT